MSYCGMAMNPNGTSSGSDISSLTGLGAVDVDHLPAHRMAASRMACSTPIPLEHLERTRLHANGFRVLRRLGSGSTIRHRDTAPGQFDGRGQADRARAGDEDVGVVGVWHTGDYAVREMVRLRPWATTPTTGSACWTPHRAATAGQRHRHDVHAVRRPPVLDLRRLPRRGHPADRHPPRADCRVRGRGLVEGDPVPGVARADRRARVSPTA